MNKTEAQFTTSSLGQVAYLLWCDVYPDQLTFEPLVACVYYEDPKKIDDLIGKYWCGYTGPVCEISECIVVANRILRSGEVRPSWYEEMKEAIKEVRDDYINPLRG